MKVSQIAEGGWTDTLTQQTRLTPNIVKLTLKTVEQFTNDFNKYLRNKKADIVTMGAPTGSSAYYKVDERDVEYGDIDLQMITKDVPGKTISQVSVVYNEYLDDFITTVAPEYIHNTGKPAHGHPIFHVEENIYVQVDMLWATKGISDWAQWRSTPQQGVKGLIYGNIYSSLGEIMNMSLQTAGVQIKIKDGEPANFQRTRKYDELVNISTDIENFGMDILEHIYKAVNGSRSGLLIDPGLRKNPGLNKGNVQIADLANTVKGLANSFASNDLYGQYNLVDYANTRDFLDAYLAQFLKKSHEAKNAPKLNKAESPEELAKVDELRSKIEKGEQLVQSLFSQ